jgi:hypothetical protein
VPRAIDGEQQDVAIPQREELGAFPHRACVNVALSGGQREEDSVKVPTLQVRRAVEEDRTAVAANPRTHEQAPPVAVSPDKRIAEPDRVELAWRARD